MDKIMRPVWAEIDLDILANNVREYKKISWQQGSGWPVVKADAYGTWCSRCCSLPFRKWSFKTCCCNAYWKQLNLEIIHDYSSYNDSWIHSIIFR